MEWNKSLLGVEGVSNLPDRQKFELAEIILYSLFGLFIDFLCLVLDMTMFGYPIATFLQFLATIGFGFILNGKGNKEALSFRGQIGSQLFNLAPVLPTVFGSSLKKMISHNNPKVGLIAGRAPTK